MSILPRTIRLKLDEVRETLRGYLWLQCLLMIASWLMMVFWLAAAMDYLPVRVGAGESPRWLRAGFLILMGAGSLWCLLGWMLPRRLAKISDESLALLIERINPKFANELVTAVELSDKDVQVSDPTAHAVLLDRVFSRADAAIQEVQIQQLFNWRPIRVLRWLTISGLVFTGLAAALQWNWFALWSQRLFVLSDQPWPRQALLRADWLQMPIPSFTGQIVPEQLRLKFLDGIAHVPSGASLLFQVSANASANQVPEVCTLYYRTEDGTRGRANLRRIGSPVDGWQQFNLDGPPLDGVNSDLSLDVIGLDARLRNLKLQVVDPMVITELQLSLQYPSYLLDSFSVRAGRELLPYRAGLKIPEGTQCTLIGRCNSVLQKVQYVVRPSGGVDNSHPPEVLESTSKDNSFEIPLGQLLESQLVEIRLQDQYGLSSDQVMRYNLLVVPDQIPEVQSRLEGIGLAITPKAFLPVRGSVVDDHAVKEVFAEISVDEATLQPVKLQWADQQLSGEVDFAQLAEQGVVGLQPGMTVGLSVVAKDYYDLNELPHDGRGQPVQLAVVSQDQLLVLLDRNELELRQRLEQIISELKQLNEVLQTMSQQLAGTVAMLVMQPPRAAEEQAPLDLEQADREANRRLSVLRAQQAQLQTDKSRQELLGVANRVEHLRLQLIHNRIDSLDRQQRLLDQVHSPMVRILADEYVGFEKQIAELQSATMAGIGQIQATRATVLLDKILIGLEAIKASMMDIESFNELVDLVRGLLEEQERVLKQTEETQKARVLDLFQ